MRVRVIVPAADSQRLREDVVKSGEKIEHEETNEQEWEVVSKLVFNPHHLFTEPGGQQTMLIDPSAFRSINELLQKECKNRGRIETLTFAATASG